MTHLTAVQQPVGRNNIVVSVTILSAAINSGSKHSVWHNLKIIISSTQKIHHHKLHSKILLEYNEDIKLGSSLWRRLSTDRNSYLSLETLSGDQNMMNLDEDGGARVRTKVKCEGVVTASVQPPRRIWRKCSPSSEVTLRCMLLYEIGLQQCYG